MAEVGRPTDYKEEYAEQGYRLCLLGAIDKDLADFFEVSEATINNWKIAHPEFLESIKRGKQIADTQVADRLYQRALGYEHEDLYLTQYQGEIVEKTITKHYPPDTTAAIFWLKNRQPSKWRDRTETDVKSGGKPIPILAPFNVPTHNGNQQNSQAPEADQGSPGGNVSEQDNLDTPIVDKLGAERQTANADLSSIGVNAPPEAGSDTGLPSDNGNPSVFQGSKVE